jgi:hypothetical protein
MYSSTKQYNSITVLEGKKQLNTYKQIRQDMFIGAVKQGNVQSKTTDSARTYNSGFGEGIC